MNEYECIDKVLFDPKVFFVLQQQDEKACEIGVNFNLEQIFREAERISLEEEGFKTIIEILDGKFGVGTEEVNQAKEDEIERESQYDMELQQLAIEYLKSNINRQKIVDNNNLENSSGILTPDMAQKYMEKLKTISNSMDDNMAYLTTMDFDDHEFENSKPELNPDGAFQNDDEMTFHPKLDINDGKQMIFSNKRTSH
jgi:hypothetical protein